MSDETFSSTYLAHKKVFLHYNIIIKKDDYPEKEFAHMLIKVLLHRSFLESTHI